MPCTYCGNPNHTRKQCEEINNDYQTYLKVSSLVREEYINRLTELGLVPGAVVRTYNRTKNFMNTSSEVAIEGLGDVDMFSCYSGAGKKGFAVESPTKEHIVLADEDDRMVTPNHCYEVIEPSDSKWNESWITTQLLDFESFKAMFKGKKRHIGFEATKFGCVVKKYTTHQETVDEMIARLNRESEEEESMLNQNEDQAGNPIYVITVTSTSDCYKRPHADTWAKTATSYEDAKAVAAQIYLEHVSDYETFEYEKDLFGEFQAAISDTDDIVTSVYDFFTENSDTLFQGEYVPCTFSVDLSEEATTTCSSEKITEIVEELVEILTEG